MVAEAFRRTAVIHLVARLMREVRVLRAIVKELPAGTTACNRCFRDFPHSSYAHEQDEIYLGCFPDWQFDENGYLPRGRLGEP